MYIYIYIYISNKNSMLIRLPLPQCFCPLGRRITDRGLRKTRTKTQTTPDTIFIGERRHSDHGLSFGVCPPVLQKLVLCVPFWYGWWGSCGQPIQANVQGPMKPNASPGAQSEAPRRRWRPGREQHSGQENQNSQHMLDQPRGSVLRVSGEGKLRSMV